jgi:hypothetical protein
MEPVARDNTAVCVPLSVTMGAGGSVPFGLLFHLACCSIGLGPMTRDGKTKLKNCRD